MLQTEFMTTSNTCIVLVVISVCMAICGNPVDLGRTFISSIAVDEAYQWLVPLSSNALNLNPPIFTMTTSDFKNDETFRRISALRWSTDLRQLPKLNFIQLYDCLVVWTCKYCHIVLKGTNYKKLKSFQFFFEGNVKKLESKVYEGKTYVKATVLSLMKKSPYPVVMELTPQCDVSRAACTCPAGLGSQGKRKYNHVGGVLFALEDFTRRGLQKHPEPLTFTSHLSVWVVPCNQSVAAKPLDQVLIRKIRLGRKIPELSRSW